jgi:hypothetical protein
MMNVHGGGGVGAGFGCGVRAARVCVEVGGVDGHDEGA